MKPADLKYLPYIDGLRALAVFAVFIFHLMPNVFPGGYLGVDVFFVISGFVISQSLYKRYLTDGRINITSFYIKRFMRLFPPVMAMVFFVTIAYILFGFLWDTNLFIKSALSAIFAFSNIYFIKHGDNYFDEGLLNPLVHTWSLGVEEQFYVIYPLALVAMFIFFRHRKNIPVLTVSLIFILVSIILFFAFYFNNDQNIWGNYYWPFARFWEILVGCSLFFLSLRFRIKKYVNVTMFAGLGILCGAFLYSSSIDNVPLETLLAVLGTSLIIYGGLENQVGFITKIFSLPVIVYVGVLSYSLYLWHFPIIYFLGLYVPNNLYILLSPAFTLICGYLSYHFIEQRLRHSERFEKLIRITLRPNIVVPILVLAITTVAVYGFSNTLYAINSSLNNFGTTIKQYNLIEYKADLGERIQPNYFLNGINVHQQCGEGTIIESDQIHEICLKEQSSKNLIYLTGDSHASHLLPMIDSADLDSDVYFQAYPRADFLTEEHSAALENQVSQIKAFSQKYDQIILINSSYFKSSDDHNLLMKQLNNYVENFKDLANVVLVAPTPVFPFGPASCVASGVHCVVNTMTDKQSQSDVNSSLESVSKQYEYVSLYDVYDEICQNQYCEIYDSQHDFLRYRDDDHLSVEGSKALSRHFEEWFKSSIWQEK